jgi:hypothetical protein
MGIYLDRKQYHPAVKEIAIALIQKLRPFLVLRGDAEKGRRFNDDNHVFTLLESGTTEQDFREEPHANVDGALLEAAESDFWYNHEKKWDYTEETEEESSDDY